MINVFLFLVLCECGPSRVTSCFPAQVLVVAPGWGTANNMRCDRLPTQLNRRAGTSWYDLCLPSLFSFLSFSLDPKTATETETEICAEWEIKTITSALKTYLR